jgi:hypothetical protein
MYKEPTALGYRKYQNDFEAAMLTRLARHTSFVLGLFCLEFPELLRPGRRRRETNLIPANQGANLGQPVLRAEVSIAVAAAKGLGFSIQQMERCVKCRCLVHLVFPAL